VRRSQISCRSEQRRKSTRRTLSGFLRLSKLAAVLPAFPEEKDEERSSARSALRERNELAETCCFAFPLPLSFCGCRRCCSRSVCLEEEEAYGPDISSGF
jgi:hypothetical protein